ncbi:hypothetical protein [Candidatus Aalborgicola defluviihabitans]|uniref:hypothetical protein n=1 Tax=Candidatus Aalborgicola defluviihabitans TaxID=3386187 RepID=UPI001EB4D7E2|nr:hypothetical protein [Burkholderiales bacterium]
MPPTPHTVNLNGSGVAGGVALSPTTLSFAAQAVAIPSAGANSHPATNTGGAALNIASIIASGDFAVTTTPARAWHRAVLHPERELYAHRGGCQNRCAQHHQQRCGQPHSLGLSGTGVASTKPILRAGSRAAATVSLGSASTLTANCSPAATSYNWTGGTCASNLTASCSVTPSATTAYSVTGTNADGAGNTASASVTVVPLAFGLTVIRSGRALAL